MNKVIVIPDSFKGTMTSLNICTIMKQSILSFFPFCQVLTIPIADGGEGTVDCFLNITDAKKIMVNTTNPYGEKIEAYYAKIKEKAIIEMASAAGITLVGENLNPCKTTTYGVGTMIRHAIEHGCKEIILGLGGSCTNDGGVGAFSALGCRFYKKDGTPFLPTGGSLNLIEQIDDTEMNQLFQGIKVIAMCDITNPLYGENGAASVFAPQKGADVVMVNFLDHNLRYYAKLIQQKYHLDPNQIQGAGAAGGFGAGAVSFLKGELYSGIQTILDTIHFEQLLDGVDCVFTGEGKIDEQSLSGKAVVGIGRRCKNRKIPVIAVVGDMENQIDSVYQEGVSAIFSINKSPLEYKEAKKFSEENLKLTMDNIMRFYKCFWKK